MTDLAKLISDLEAATEGSRDLSDRVLLACGWVFALGHPAIMSESYWQAPEVNERILILGEQPSPTESIDDAVALVPEGKRLALESDPNADGVNCHAAISQMFFGHALTLPLALCIAVLKVRESK